MHGFRAASVPSPYRMMVSVVMSKATRVPGFSCDLSNWNTVIANETISGNVQRGFFKFSAAQQLLLCVCDPTLNSRRRRYYKLQSEMLHFTSQTALN